MPDEIEQLDRGDGLRLAYRLQAARRDCHAGATPTLVFLPGLRSDMTGDKATALAAHAAANGHGMLRLDYSGHGGSDGRFEDGTIGRWTQDALALIDRLTAGPLVLVGSSMGGWIALLVALARPHRVGGLVGIAAAPDFTETHLWAELDAASRTRLLADGLITLDSPYGAPLPVTSALIEDGRTHRLLGEHGGADRITCPIRLLQGQQDDQVPWRTALQLAASLGSTDVQLVLIKDGDHRLSRPADLALLLTTVTPLLRNDASAGHAAAAFLGQDGAQSFAEGRVAPGDAERLARGQA